MIGQNSKVEILTSDHVTQKQKKKTTRDVYKYKNRKQEIIMRKSPKLFQCKFRINIQKTNHGASLSRHTHPHHAFREEKTTLHKEEINTNV